MAMCEAIFERKTFSRGTSFGRSTIGMGVRGTQYTNSLRSEFGGHNEAFCFRPRAGKLNIRLLHSIDPEQVMADGDLETIRAHMDNLTFSKITESDLRAFNDEFLAKLLHLFQLSMEYLYSVAQNDRMTNEQLTEVNQELQQNMIAMDGKMAVQKSQMQQLYKENKYKTKQLEIYEAMLPGHARVSQGLRTSARFGCPQCGKNFESDEYLKSHLARRHGDYTQQEKLSSVLQSPVDIPALHRAASLAAQTADTVPASLAPEVPPSVPSDAALGQGQTPDWTHLRQQRHEDVGRSVPSVDLQASMNERTILEETSKVNDQVVCLRQELEDQMSRMREEVSTMVSDIKAPLEVKVDSLTKANETLKESLSERLSFAPALHEQVQNLKALVEVGQRRKSKAGELESDTDSDAILAPPIRAGASAPPATAAINTAVESALRSSQQSLLSQISHLQIQSKQHNLRLEELVKDKLQLQNTRSAGVKSTAQQAAATAQQATPLWNGESTRVTTPSVTPPIASDDKSPCVDDMGERTESKVETMMIDHVNSTSVILDSDVASPASPAMMVHSFHSGAPSAEEGVEAERLEPSEHAMDSAYSTSSIVSVTESKVDEAQSCFLSGQVGKGAEQASKWTDGLNNFLDDAERAKYMINMNFEGHLGSTDLCRVLESQGLASRVLTEQEKTPWAHQTKEPSAASAPVDEPHVRDPLISSTAASSSGEPRATKLAGEETEVFAVERIKPIKELEKTVDRAFRSSWNFFIDNCRKKPPMGTNRATRDLWEPLDRQEPSIDASQLLVIYADGSRVTFLEKGLPPILLKIENGVEGRVESFFYDSATAMLADIPACPEGRQLPRPDANRIIMALQKLATSLGVPGLDSFRDGTDVERSASLAPPDHIPSAGPGPLSANMSRGTTPAASYTSGEGGSMHLSAPLDGTQPRNLQTQSSRVPSKEARGVQHMQSDEATPSFGSNTAAFMSGVSTKTTTMNEEQKRGSALVPPSLWEDIEYRSSVVLESPLNINNNQLDNSWDASGDGVQPFYMSSTSSPVQDVARRQLKLVESTADPQGSVTDPIDRWTGTVEKYATSPRTPPPDTITTADNRWNSAAYGSNMKTVPANDNNRWNTGPKDPVVPQVSSVTSFMGSRDMGTSSAPAGIFNRPPEFSRPPPAMIDSTWEADDLDLEEIQ
eukprot:GEMP01002161.1.p1 GENE.GEMP01002161.1~~GEMP01002161.1.p1  ORF type:complete len:1177 (+),score=294.43 GEMP01002161.1:99-3629(+)